MGEYSVDIVSYNRHSGRSHMFLGKCSLQTYLTLRNHFQDNEEVLILPLEFCFL